MPLDYETLYKQAYKTNVENIAQAVERGEINEKIDNFCQLHGFEKEHVVEQIKTNKIVAACFAINPNKQNFYENVAADYIKEISGVKKFKNLSRDKLVVSQGAVITKTELHKRGGAAQAKTIDFQWEYGNAKFYASHKYTKQEGGSQGNQYKDLQTFIEQAIPTSLKNTYFVAIADGEFYSRNDGQAGISRIERLKQLASNRVIFACTICELEKLMTNIIR